MRSDKISSSDEFHIFFSGLKFKFSDFAWFKLLDLAPIETSKCKKRPATSSQTTSKTQLSLFFYSRIQINKKIGNFKSSIRSYTTQNMLIIVFYCNIVTYDELIGSLTRLFRCIPESRKRWPSERHRPIRSGRQNPTRITRCRRRPRRRRR